MTPDPFYSIHVTGFPDDGLRLIAPDDQHFDELARPLLGRFADRALRAKPYLTIVCNDSSRSVVAYTVTFLTRYDDGTTNTSNVHFKCPDGVSPGGVTLAAAVRGADVEGYLPPKGSAMAANGWAATPGNLEYSDDQSWLDGFVEQRDDDLRGATALHILLDAVIFDDGELIGADQADLGVHFQAYVDEKQRIYRDMVGRLEQYDASLTALTGCAGGDGPPDFEAERKDPRQFYARQASGDVIVAARKVLLDAFGPAVRAEPFLVRRRPDKLNGAR